MAEEDRIRIDKWLWQARFFKTRSLAAAVISKGHLRLNGVKMAKPGRAVAQGDVLTFSQAADIRVIRIRACGTRRGPSEEARGLYDDLALPDGGGSPGPAG